jgi:hypothetical protein
VLVSSPALTRLERTRQHLRAARVDAQDVPAYLAGARASRADELAEKLADALAHAERLCFICEADARYELERDR